MKTLLPNFCALLLLNLSTAGPAEASRPNRATLVPMMTPMTDEQLFTKLVTDVGAAIEKKDIKALGELMAPDYTHYNPSNRSGRKADELAFLATWPPTTVKLVGAVQVSHSGNMAVTVSQHQYSSVENGQSTSQIIQHMIAWTLNQGKWQMAIVQSKEIPA